MPPTPAHALEPGQVVDRDVRNFHGQLLLPAGTVLTSQQIRLLRSWGADEVHVRGATQAATPPTPSQATSAEALRLASELIVPLFRHNDPAHPLARELMRLAVAHEASSPKTGTGR